MVHPLHTGSTSLCGRYELRRGAEGFNHPCSRALDDVSLSRPRLSSSFNLSLSSCHLSGFHLPEKFPRSAEKKFKSIEDTSWLIMRNVLQTGTRLSESNWTISQNTFLRSFKACSEATRLTSWMVLQNE